MFRNFCFVVVAFFLVLLCADAVLAQADTWPNFPMGGEDGTEDFQRSSGGYFSWIKLFGVLLIYLLWVKTTDWVNKDCQLLQLPYTVWNVVVFASFVIGMLLVLTIPVFAAGFSVLCLAYIAPLGVYVVTRNRIVDPHERVMTPSHFRYLIATQANKSGVKIADQKKAAHQKGAPVVFEAQGNDKQKNQANLISARQSPGFLPAKELVAEIIRQRGDKCMMDFSRDSVAMRYQIDGVWHESEGQGRESGDEMLEVFKTLAGLSVKERRQRQSGRFTSEFGKTVYQCTLISQGTQNGERVILQVDRPRSAFPSLADLGMRGKIEEKLKELLAVDSGMVLISSPPAGGLSTTMGLVLKLTDRYTRDFVALQDINAPEPLVENVELTTYDISKGKEPAKLLETMLRREPNAVIVNELPNVETVQMLCDEASKDKLVITTVRAKEAVESLLRVLLMKVSSAKFAPAVAGVLNQRLIRRICEECKQGYEPSAQVLKKMGIPQGRVEHLFRPPDPSEQDKVCEKCNGIGYFGRIGIFELLVVDDEMRKALMKQPKLDVLRQISRQAGNRNLQQEGIVLVAQGITSVQELSRVLKQ
ncbi:MAG: ATPase, T2SS/T4P/T4SS family [Pirellulaceae bacterium]|nr:ATPase, T2SS/T4P/T4SS family [Pirellulaceae bacterium]